MIRFLFCAPVFFSIQFLTFNLKAQDSQNPALNSNRIGSAKMNRFMASEEPTDSYGEFKLLDENWKSNWQDFKDLHVNPVFERGTDSTSGAIWLSGLASVALARREDDRMREKWVDHQKMNTAQSEVGDLVGTGAFSAVAIGLQYAFDDRAYVFESHARGFIYGGATIYTMKTIFNRKRPGHSRNYQSFPSGHTTIMFMSATHLWQAYDWKVGVPVTALAALTGLSRLSDDAHWFSDVTAGVFLGAWVARATFYDAEVSSTTDEVTRDRSQKNYDLVPFVSRDGTAGLSAFLVF